ncbi:unknown [Clostridium sp. CAG:1024]|nr:unknown [Clostridium sp. CAG:1024]
MWTRSSPASKTCGSCSTFPTTNSSARPTTTTSRPCRRSSSSSTIRAISISPAIRDTTARPARVSGSNASSWTANAPIAAAPSSSSRRRATSSACPNTPTASSSTSKRTRTSFSPRAAPMRCCKTSCCPVSRICAFPARASSGGFPSHLMKNTSYMFGSMHFRTTLRRLGGEATTTHSTRSSGLPTCISWARRSCASIRSSGRSC